MGERNEELNRKAAELMGWEAQYKDFQAVDQRLTYYEKETSRERGLVRNWNPCSDMNQARMLLDFVKEENIYLLYLNNLLAVMDLSQHTHERVVVLWLVLNATPRQITEAFVRTMEDTE